MNREARVGASQGGSFPTSSVGFSLPDSARRAVAMGGSPAVAAGGMVVVVVVVVHWGWLRRCRRWWQPLWLVIVTCLVAGEGSYASLSMTPHVRGRGIRRTVPQLPASHGGPCRGTRCLMDASQFSATATHHHASGFACPERRGPDLVSLQSLIWLTAEHTTTTSCHPGFQTSRLRSGVGCDLEPPPPGRTIISPHHHPQTRRVPNP